MHTTRFWNNLHQVRSKSKAWKAKYLKILGAIKPKTLYRIAKIGYGHLCLREENLSFINNYTIEAYLLTLPLFAGVSRVRALSPAWTGSHARETLISRTLLFLPHDIPPTKNQVQYNLDLHFAINISGNSPFGTPALMKNAERYE